MEGPPINKNELFSALDAEILKIVNNSQTPNDKKLQQICELLISKVPHYDWVGFYFAKDEVLLLGPYAGEKTEHVRIPFGVGVCGQAATKKRTVVVPDVNRECNYLSCSPKVRAEIVVPIFRENMFVGEIDIDSHRTAAFDDQDVRFLKKVCKAVASLLP